MLKAIIIDDERKNRETLETLITDFIEGVSIVDTADSVSSGKKAIDRHQPDLVFLDVEMPKQDGFELLKELSPARFEVVFITGHQHYAMRAFRAAAVDYLLKPVDIGLLQEAVNRVKRKRDKENVNQNFDALINNLSAKKQKQQIAISTSAGLIFIQIEDIIYCRGDGAYTYFFTKGGQKITVSKNLKEYERLLDEFNFFRTHKSYLINLDEMKRYIRGEGGYVVMSNGDSVGVAKRRKENFLAALSKV